jgi:arginyl-tRNA--protein-N-Asp/Glu arginylyltransferase
VFGDKYYEIDLGMKWLHNVFRIAKQNIDDCSMMVFQVDERLHKLIKRKKDFYIPVVVRGEVDIPLTVSNSSMKNDLRKIRKNNLELEVTTEKSQLHRFYHDMYLPYITHRHGNRNVATSYDELMRYWESGTCELLLIKKEDEHIGGQVIVFEKNRPRLLVTGIKDGNPRYLKYGAGVAGYYLASSYLAKHGYRSFHLGCIWEGRGHF